MSSPKRVHLVRICTYTHTRFQTIIIFSHIRLALSKLLPSPSFAPAPPLPFAMHCAPWPCPRTPSPGPPPPPWVSLCPGRGRGCESTILLKMESFEDNHSLFHQQILVSIHQYYTLPVVNLIQISGRKIQKRIFILRPC